MGKKYFTLSFDDGLEQDKRIIALMKQYGLKGTFNLNSGLFGQRGEVMGLGSFSFRDCEEGAGPSPMCRITASRRTRSCRYTKAWRSPATAFAMNR